MRLLLRPAATAVMTAIAVFGVVSAAAADCTCRAGGRDHGLGSSVCLPTPAGLRLAVCDMVLNNTSWRISATPCVGARLDDRLPQEFLTARHPPPRS